MYLSQLGLDSRPFALAPDITMMVWTPQLEEVRRRIAMAVDDRVPVVVLTGDVGGGKSTLILDLVDRFSGEGDLQIVLLRGGIEDADDMLEAIAHRIDDGASEEDPLQRIADAVAGTPALLICDEAQVASPAAVLALADLAGRTGRLTVLLSGQPELRGRLAGPEYRGLDVPAEHRHHLARLSEADARAYIAARLRKAGGDAELIAPEAAGYIARVAQFVPRRINKVADACLFLASLEERSQVDEAFARRIVRENLDPETLALNSMTEAPASPPAPDPIGTAVERAASARPLVPALPDGAPTAAPERSPLPALRATPRPGDVATLRRSAGPSAARRAAPWVAAGVALAGVAGFALLGPFAGDADVDPVPRVAVEEGAPASDSAPAAPDPPEAVPPVPEAAATPDAPPRRLEARAIAEKTAPGALDFYEEALSSDDPKLAAVNYARAAIRGHARSARYLGQQFELGDGVTFSPAMARRWYDVAEGRTPSDAPTPDAAASAVPLLAAEGKGGLDLVWDGVGAAFVVELGDADRRPIAQFTSEMTAASVAADPQIAFWRVRPDPGDFSPWAPVAEETPPR